MGSGFQLPDGKSPSLALVHPTEEEKLIQFNLNGEQWRGALSHAAYIRREEVLSSQALTQDGGITYWILVDTSIQGNPLDPSSSARLPLASCETYCKRALVWQNGKTRETICHGIGSVFCAPHLRKRGFAQRMMMELGEALRKHQTTETQECVFSVLFSDIGKKFYADLGWEPFNSAHVSIPAGISKMINGQTFPTVRPLYEDDLEELCKIDEALIRKSLESRGEDCNTAVALIPDVKTVRWHHARENFVGNELHGKLPEIKGAIVGCEKGERVWCYWTRMWYNENPNEAKGNTLHILRLVIENEGDSSWERSATTFANGSSMDQSHVAAIAALLMMAQREAEAWKMEEVEAWNPSSATLAAAQKLYADAKIVDRDSESIASLQWFPPHHGRIAESIDWIGNEKYGWC